MAIAYSRAFQEERGNVFADVIEQPIYQTSGAIFLASSPPSDLGLSERRVGKDSG